MKRSWFYAEIDNGSIIPHMWLGRAWYNYTRDSSVYLPIPLNRIARALRELYFTLRHPEPSAWEEAQYAVIERVRSRAYWEGHEDGFDLGRKR